MAGRHAAPEGPSDPRAREVRGRRPGPKHDGGAPRKPRKPQVRPTSAAPAAPAAPRVATGTSRTRAVGAEARDYAHRQMFRASSTRPSVTGRAASGAAAGLAAGAAIGGPVGAGVGTVVGGAGGAVAGSRAKKAYRLATRPYNGARKLLVAEFAICIVVATMSPLTDEKKTEKPGDFLKRMTAIMGLFFILGLVSAGGREAGRFAAGLGGIVTVGLVVAERNLFNQLAAIVSRPSKTPAVGTGPMTDPDTGASADPESDTAMWEAEQWQR